MPDFRRTRRSPPTPSQTPRRPASPGHRSRRRRTRRNRGIGPGLGAMTGPLIEQVGRLHAVELDRDLIPRLKDRFGEHLSIHEADALRFDFAALADELGPLRVVGNLPYNISTPLLFHLLASSGRIVDMHFMLQKEVVDRLCAEPGTGEYGRLTVCVAARAEARRLMKVGPGAFNPPPKVDSAIVRLVPRPPPFEIKDLSRFDALVAAAFAQRRKTLNNTLKGVVNAEQFAAAGIDPGLRAERLSPADFARLTATL